MQNALTLLQGILKIFQKNKTTRWGSLGNLC